MPADSPIEPNDLVHAWNDSLRFAERPETIPRSQARDIVVGAGVLALHVLCAWLLEVQSRPHPAPAAIEQITVVDFIATLPEEIIRAPAIDAPSTRAAASPASRPRSEVIRDLPSRPIDNVPIRTAKPLQLYRQDGSIAVPADVLADLERNAGDARRFDFQVPDLEKAGHWLDRPPALVYEATRFEKYYQPNRTLLDEVLSKAVEKTTKEVRIPIPGAPGRELVCYVSILAAGGGCGVERYEGIGLRPGIDDPATLDESEAAACQAWWDRIVGASSQGEWQRTRKLYDEECRKPLAKDLPPPPPAQAGAPATAQ